MIRKTITAVMVSCLFVALGVSGSLSAQTPDAASSAPPGPPPAEGPAGFDYPPGNLWDNGAFDGSNALTSERATTVTGTGGPEGNHGSTTADDFELDSSTAIAEIRACFMASAAVTVAEMYIYEDDGGQPGPTVNAPVFGAPTTASIVSSTYEDNSSRCYNAFGYVGRQFIFNSTTTGESFPVLDAGTYWLAVVGDGQGDTSTRAFWAVSTPAVPLSIARFGSTFFGYSYWSAPPVNFPVTEHFAFDIDGEGSEPRATFAVSKDFADDNPNGVEVTISCNTGLPLEQSKVISEGDGVEFVVVDFDSGELDCEITEEDFDGYSAEYYNGGENSSTSCEFDDVLWGSARGCRITNIPEQVDVNVDKVWVLEGTGGDELDARFELTLICNGQIADFQQDNDGLWRWTVYGDDTGGLGMRARVTPDWDGGTDCWVEETVYDNSVETDNGCQIGSLHIEIGQGASCVITNTVFYEGIPALNRYGLALLALALLGVGFVGFRRFA